MCEIPSILELLKVSVSSPRDRLLHRQPRIKVAFVGSASHANQYPVHLFLQCYCFTCFSLLSCIGQFLLRYLSPHISKFESHFLVFLTFSILLHYVSVCTDACDFFQFRIISSFNYHVVNPLFQIIKENVKCL